MMWEFGNLWSHEAGTSNPLAYPSSSYLSVMHELHVLVVDHDSDSLINTARLLESCQYRATIFEFSSGALQLLSSGKVKVDLIMANINSPDLHGPKLLQQAAVVEIPVILMTTDENAFMAMKALENGVYGYVKKPVAIELLKCMWQHVLREKIKASKQRELQMMAANYNVCGGIGNPNNVTLGCNAEGINNMVAMDKSKSKINDYKKGGYNQSHMVDSKIKRKVCTEWTQDLHEKFMHAVTILGEGRCFPKEILELMGVPGLTRMQVASHLQKCRNDNWRSPEERKSTLNARQNAHSVPDTVVLLKPRRFGSMPKASKTSTGETSGEGAGEGMKTPQSETEVQNVENMETEPAPVVLTAEINPPYYPQYEPIVHHHGTNAYPGNPMNTSDDHFLNLLEMDFLVGFPDQLSAGLDTIASYGAAASSGYHFEPTYHQLEQNPNMMPSVENGSQWSSESTTSRCDD